MWRVFKFELICLLIRIYATVVKLVYFCSNLFFIQLCLSTFKFVLMLLCSILILSQFLINCSNRHYFILIAFSRSLIYTNRTSYKNGNAWWFDNPRFRESQGNCTNASNLFWCCLLVHSARNSNRAGLRTRGTCSVRYCTGRNFYRTSSHLWPCCGLYPGLYIWTPMFYPYATAVLDSLRHNTDALPLSHCGPGLVAPQYRCSTPTLLRSWTRCTTTPMLHTYPTAVLDSLRHNTDALPLRHCDPTSIASSIHSMPLPHGVMDE